MAHIERDLGRAVVYQIYIKSFCDSNGDGIGDLPGITSKLDYLRQLGVDYLWITPFYPSPQRDNGYDVSDYRAVDPRYGTMDDFRELVAEAHARDLGIMLDMVLCHTSCEHEWFQRALAGDERYRRYYLLRSGRGSTGPGDPGEPPTNWNSIFGGSAWEWEPRLDAWYLHMHDVSQPDLDWTNPEVRSELADVVRFWKDLGVDGFRFDVINLISKPEILVDEPAGNGRRLVADGPHVHEYLRELVECAGIGELMMVGEMASTTLGECVRYTAPASRELDMAFNFHHLKVDYRNGRKWEIADPDISMLRDVFRTWQEGMQENDGWNALFWNNHDQPRAISRFGGRGGAGRPDSSWEKVGRMLGICLHFMRGTPFVYQGEELGMTNPSYGSIEEFDDVESRNHYRIMIESGKSAAEALRIVNERSRDDGRSPMQWSAGENAGFTTGRPWIGVAANYPLVNAQDECASEDSMYAFYRRLIELRKKLEVVSCGAIRFLEAGSGAPKVIAYERTHDHVPAGQPKHLVAICSFDDEPCRAEFSLRRDGVRECAPDGESMAGDASIPFVIPAGAKVLAGNYSGVMFDGDAVCLRPFEALALAW